MRHIDVPCGICHSRYSLHNTAIALITYSMIAGLKFVDADSLFLSPNKVSLLDSLVAVTASNLTRLTGSTRWHDASASNCTMWYTPTRCSRANRPNRVPFKKCLKRNRVAGTTHPAHDE